MRKSSGRTIQAVAIVLLLCPGAFARTHRPTGGIAPSSRFTIQDLEKFSRALKQKNPGQAYSQLSAAVSRKSSESLGLRAALALGFYDYGRGHYPQAAKWLAVAKNDNELGDYALYWNAETEIAQGDNGSALAELQSLRKEFPDSVMTEQALESLGAAALASNRLQDAISALNAYTLTGQRPGLLFLRAQARERTGALAEAAADYQTLYMRFAASELGRQAGIRLDFVRASSPGIPALTPADRLAHANILFDAKEWERARGEYAQLLPNLSGVDLERARLRILECGLSLGGSISELAAIPISDPEVDAERYYALCDFYRSQHLDPELKAAVETTVSRAPSSRWAEAALFLAGNYYWVQLERDQASSYYKRLAEQFPSSPAAAEWRVAWTATLSRQPEAADLLEKQLKLFPGSPFTPDALYWLGRLSEEAEAVPVARSYYQKLTERYPLNYFGTLATERLRMIGPGATQDPGVLDALPPLLPVPKIGSTIPEAAADRQARANALRSIGFDTSAELELRAGYTATGEPLLLLEAAEEAAAAQQYGAAILTIRQMVPQMEARGFDDLPREAWVAAYALPFEPSIRRWSAAGKLDPMLVAGLIHQESAFQTEARSPKNAMGLMQLLPQTARRVSKQSRVNYSQARLSDPDYNIRIGTVYFAGLEKQFGTVEAALAAYNAGEDRVIAWTAGSPYREMAEFVDSIPFTETRQYVEIIARNAEIYRRLYGVKNESSGGKSAPHGHRHS